MGKHWSLSEEERRKRSERMRGALNPRFGKPHSEETRKTISLVKRGVIPSRAKARPGYAEGIRNASFGKHVPERRKQRQRETLKGRKPTPEQLARQKEGLNRPETKERISKASQNWWAEVKASGKMPVHLREKTEATKTKISKAIKAQWASDPECMRSRLAEGRRKGLRNAFTRPERMLLSRLCGHSPILKVEAAYRIGRYVLDLALVDARVGIEVDGCYWHGCVRCGFAGSAVAIHNRKSSDRKEAFLQACGWLVIRVWEHEIHEDLEAAVRRIVGEAEERLMKGGATLMEVEEQAIRMRVAEIICLLSDGGHTSQQLEEARLCLEEAVKALRKEPRAAIATG